MGKVTFLLKHRGEMTHMILAEDFRELHMKNEKKLSYSAGVAKGKSKGRSEGIAKGIAKGKNLLLLQMVCKKLQKGMTAEEIADILEQDTAKITRICRVAEKFAPDYDCELIYKELQK